MKNQLCDLLNIKYPIIQGGMTNVSDSKLVTAVSNAGGLGTFAPGIEAVDLDWVRSEIRKIKRDTPNPFAVNIMLASDYASEIIDIVCEEQVPIITTGAGNPERFLLQLFASDIKVIPVVATVRAAVKMEALGVHAVAVSGMEGGGYIGNLCTTTLLPQVTDSISIPVIAAGGFADGRGLSAAIAYGAQGIQMGTRFLTTQECDIPVWCKEALIKADSDDAIILGNRIGAKARLRVLRTKITEDILNYEFSENADLKIFEKMISEARNQIYKKGLEGTLIGVSQSIGLITDEPTAASLIASIIKKSNISCYIKDTYKNNIPLASYLFIMITGGSLLQSNKTNRFT